MNKTTYFSRLQNGVLALGCAMLLFSCSHLEPFSLESEDVLRSETDGPTVIPDIIEDGPGGNTTCEDIGYDTEDEFTFSSGRIDYENNPDFEESFAPFKITVRDETYVDWVFEPFEIDGILYCLKEVSFIVKGGNASNVYTYKDGETHDNNLKSPINDGGQQPELSNLTICYILEPCEDVPPGECYEEETAWADGTRYVSTGNWATYTSDDQLNIGVKLLAGQDKYAGDVIRDGGNIVITLKEGWRFAELEDDDNVKIERYENAPNRNPDPGRFSIKRYIDPSKTTASIPVAVANFYGIHVDVEFKIECQVDNGDE